MAAAIKAVMRPRHKKSPLPRLWLFTDERVNEGDLLAALDRLPRGSGVVLRHYGLGRGERHALAGRIGRIARRRGLIMLIAGEAEGLSPLHASGLHQPQWMARRACGPGPALLSAAAHDLPGLATARRAGADLAFLSPVFATRSHAGARALGPVRFGLLARQAKLPVVALGGMDEARFRRMKPLGAYGWAGIDALVK